MSEIDIRSDMRAPEIITAAKELRARLDTDIQSANGKMKDWQRAEQNYRRQEGTLEFNFDDGGLFIDSCAAAIGFEVHMASASLLLAKAMLSLRRLEVDKKSGSEYRTAGKAALASADVLEHAAMARRDICTKLRIPLVEEKVAEIIKAIQYARECRAEVGAIPSWWRFGS